MKNILVTGSQGFVGKNLVTALKRRADADAVNVLTFTSADDESVLADRMAEAISSFT